VPPAGSLDTLTVTPVAPTSTRFVTGLANTSTNAAVDALDADVPPPFVAVIANEYSCPFVNPSITQPVSGGVIVHEPDPGVAVTVYDAGVPPLVVAFTLTVADANPTTTAGASGGAVAPTVTVYGPPGLDGPASLNAAVVTVYGTPLINGVMVHDVAGDTTVQLAPPGLV
jgi:hypothetical protein